MLKINKKISAYNHFNSNNIKYIVLHDVGAKSTAKNNVDYFAGGDRGASAHYFVDDTSIWQSVEDKHGAWHCGDGYGKYGITNRNSIGIEMCLPSGAVTAKTEQNTLELVKYLMAKYNVPADRVVRHYDASRKNCPAQFNLDKKWTRWNAFKAKLTTPTTGKNDKPVTNGKVGDKVKVFDALYADSYGAGRSTAKKGETGTIKKINNAGTKKYLIENWGWSHADNIQAVTPVAKARPRHTVETYWYVKNSAGHKAVVDYCKKHNWAYKEIVGKDGRIKIAVGTFSQNSVNKLNLEKFLQSKNWNYEVKM